MILLMSVILPPHPFSIYLFLSPFLFFVYSFYTGPAVIQGHVPLDTDSVVLVLNGQEQQKIPCATRWLQHIQTLMWVDAVNCLAVVLLGSKRCTKDWINIYLRRHGVFVDLLFLVYGSPWVNDKDVFQWPVGVATYVFFYGIWGHVTRF